MLPYVRTRRVYTPAMKVNVLLSQATSLFPIESPATVTFASSASGIDRTGPGAGPGGPAGYAQYAFLGSSRPMTASKTVTLPT